MGKISGEKKIILDKNETKRMLREAQRTAARRARRAAREAQKLQEDINRALKEIKTPEQLEELRRNIQTSGTAAQRRRFKNLEHNSIVLGNTPVPKSSEPVTWNKYLTEHGRSVGQTPVSGLAEMERRAAERITQSHQHNELQDMYSKLFEYGNCKHPNATPMGNAPVPKSSESVTWNKYLTEHGRPAGQTPVSGLAEMERRAAEKLRISEQNINGTLNTGNITSGERTVESALTNNTHGKAQLSKSARTNIKIKAMIRKIKKLPLGRIGIGGLVATAIGIICCKLFTNNKENSPELTANPNTSMAMVPDDSTTAIHSKPQDNATLATTTGTNDSTTVTSYVNPADTAPVISEEKDITEIPDEITETETEIINYIVKKYDNIWNIAKAFLTEKNGRIPTNKEILVLTLKIMEMNDKEYEKDNYTVLIYPKEKLRVEM